MVFLPRGGGGENWQYVISDGVVIGCGVVQVIFCTYEWVERLVLILNLHTHYYLVEIMQFLFTFVF
jgi:hypothetical protein